MRSPRFREVLLQSGIGFRQKGLHHPEPMTGKRKSLSRAPLSRWCVFPARKLDYGFVAAQGDINAYEVMAIECELCERAAGDAAGRARRICSGRLKLGWHDGRSLSASECAQVLKVRNDRIARLNDGMNAR
jgi:hypothetical protein